MKSRTFLKFDKNLQGDVHKKDGIKSTMLKSTTNKMYELRRTEHLERKTPGISASFKQLNNLKKNPEFCGCGSETVHALPS